MPTDARSRRLFTVRAGAGGFRLLTDTARDAAASASEMEERGLIDVHVLGPDGRRLSPPELEAMISAEGNDPTPDEV